MSFVAGEGWGEGEVWAYPLPGPLPQISSEFLLHFVGGRGSVDWVHLTSLLSLFIKSQRGFWLLRRVGCRRVWGLGSRVVFR